MVCSWAIFFITELDSLVPQNGLLPATVPLTVSILCTSVSRSFFFQNFSEHPSEISHFPFHLSSQSPRAPYTDCYLLVKLPVIVSASPPQGTPPSPATGPTVAQSRYTPLLSWTKLSFLDQSSPGSVSLLLFLSPPSSSSIWLLLTFLSVCQESSFVLFYKKCSWGRGPPCQDHSFSFCYRAWVALFVLLIFLWFSAFLWLLLFPLSFGWALAGAPKHHTSLSSNHVPAQTPTIPSHPGIPQSTPISLPPKQTLLCTHVPSHKPTHIPGAFQPFNQVPLCFSWGVWGVGDALSINPQVLWKRCPSCPIRKTSRPQETESSSDSRLGRNSTRGCSCPPQQSSSSYSKPHALAAPGSRSLVKSWTRHFSFSSSQPAWPSWKPFNLLYTEDINSELWTSTPTPFAL